MDVSNQILNIAVSCTTFMKGGAEKQALMLARLLKDKGARIFIVNLDRNRIDAEYLNFIRLHSIEYIGLTGLVFLKLYRYVRFLKEKKINVIFSYLTLANFLTGLSKLFLRNKIIAVGGIRNEKLPYLKFIIEKFVHNHLNDLTVFNNYSAKDKFVARGFNELKVQVIHNSIELSRISSEKIDNNEKLIIVSVARLVKQKDFITAIHSIKKFADRRPGKLFEYWIVGYGNQKKKITSLKMLKMDNCIKILDYPQDIPKILSVSDIFLSTSIFEGLSNSILEALSAGLPIVATKVGDNQFMVKEGYNGFLIPLLNPEATAEKLEYLADNQDIRKMFGLNSRIIAEKNFSEAYMIQKYWSLIQELSEDSRKSLTGEEIHILNG